MKTENLIDLVLLAALWGASFLFMRVAADDFGPVVLIALRVGIAALFLLPVLIISEGTESLKKNWRPVFLVGVLNSVMPFTLLAFASLSLTAGFTSIINATTPLWGAIIAWWWLGDKLNKSRTLGLAIGFCGVVILLWDRLDLSWSATGMAIPAGLLAAFFYGISASYTKKYLTGIKPMTTATGSQVGAAILMLPALFLWWPDTAISTEAWVSVLVLGVASTGLAYILFFRLIANVGPATAISVTFLVPVFAVIWGGVFLSESVTISMTIGCLVVLIGTALATGFLPRGSRS